MGDLIKFSDYKDPKEYAEVAFYTNQNEEINKEYFRTKKDAYEYLYNNGYDPEGDEDKDIFYAPDNPETGKYNYYATVKWIINK